MNIAPPALQSTVLLSPVGTANPGTRRTSSIFVLSAARNCSLLPLGEPFLVVHQGGDGGCMGEGSIRRRLSRKGNAEYHPLSSLISPSLICTIHLRNLDAFGMRGLRGLPGSPGVPQRFLTENFFTVPFPEGFRKGFRKGEAPPQQTLIRSPSLLRSPEELLQRGQQPRGEKRFCAEETKTFEYKGC